METGDRNWITDATLVAALTAAGYAVAYAHELGYCNYFELPKEFIALEAVSVLRAVLSTAAACAFVIFLFNLVTVFGDGPYENRLRISGVCALMTIPFVLWSGPSTTLGHIALSIFFLSLFQGWVRPLLRFPKVEGYTAKLRADDERMAAEISDPAQPGVPFFQAALYTRRVWAHLALGLIWVLIAAYQVGGYQARTQWRFFVIPNKEPLVILRIYGEKGLAAPFDRGKWKIRRETRIVKLENDVAMKLENLGRLARP